MKRRDVLKQAAATAAVASVGASAAAGEGCATVPRAPAPRDDRAAADYLAMLDRSLELAPQMRPVHEIAAQRRPGPRSPEHDQFVAGSDAMFQRLISALFVTQSFRDLPPGTQTHPAVQTRIASHLDEIDGTVFELTSFLSAQTGDERAQLRDALRKNPNAAMDVAELLDGHAAAMGVTVERRRQLRQIMKHATFRMRTESPGALIDEYTAKVQRLRGEDGKSALALALAQKLGEDQFWRYQHHLAQDAGPGASTPATAAPAARLSPPGATRPSAVAPQPAPAAPHKPGDTAIKAGAYMLGIGVVDFGLGALIVSNTSGGVLFGIALVGGITIGALLVAIGLLTLIIGALIRLGSD
jgi:hypothetical protein